MKYYKLETSAPYCGTDETRLICSENEIEIDEEEEKNNIFDSYGYLINGWCGDNPTEEEEEEFKDDCSVELTELTEEEFNQYVEDGYSVEKW